MPRHLRYGAYGCVVAATVVAGCATTGQVDQESTKIDSSADFGPPLAQTFTAELDGWLVGVRIALEAQRSPRDLLVYVTAADELDGPHGDVLTAGVITSNPTAPPSWEWYDVEFTLPYRQSAGEALAINLEPLPPGEDHGWHVFVFSKNDPYPGGRLSYRGNFADVGSAETGRLDLAFQTIVIPYADWPLPPGPQAKSAGLTPREVALAFVESRDGEEGSARAVAAQIAGGAAVVVVGTDASLDDLEPVYLVLREDGWSVIPEFATDADPQNLPDVEPAAFADLQAWFDGEIEQREHPVDPKYARLKDALLMEEWDLSHLSNSDLMLWYGGPGKKSEIIHGGGIGEKPNRLYLRWNLGTDKLEVLHVVDGGGDTTVDVPYRLRGMIRKTAEIEGDGQARVIATGGSAGDEWKIYAQATPEE